MVGEGWHTLKSSSRNRWMPVTGTLRRRYSSLTCTLPTQIFGGPDRSDGKMDSQSIHLEGKIARWNGDFLVIVFSAREYQIRDPRTQVCALNTLNPILTIQFFNRRFSSSMTSHKSCERHGPLSSGDAGTVVSLFQNSRLSTNVRVGVVVSWTVCCRRPAAVPDGIRTGVRSRTPSA